MLIIRPLLRAELPRLAEIDPSFRSGTTLDLIRDGNGLALSWQLIERPLPIPYDKKHGYDLDFTRQHEIGEHLTPAEGFVRVAELESRLIGVIDSKYTEWNNAVTVHNLYIDQGSRGIGVGRALWAEAVAFARRIQATRIRVETQTNNVAACRFYLKMGCTVCGVDAAMYDPSIGETAIFFAYGVR